VQAVAEREYEKKTLVQMIVNGVEIIKRIPQPGEIIPIIPVIGEEVWVDEGSGAERKLISLIRLARDPQMSLAYLCSQEMEEAGLTPKTPFIGYKGQFESDSEAWKNVTKIPVSHLQVDPVVDGANGAILPLPQRVPFTPNFQQYEIAKDSCRRAIMAAMGISPLPTAAQRTNEKSKIALDKIEQMQQVGSFHFLDNWDRSLRLAGRVMNSWLPVVYDSARDLMLQKPDDSFYQVKINEPFIDEKNQEQLYKIEESDNPVTISSAPSSQSQRDEASAFLDIMIANLPNLPIAPEQQAKLLAISIKMKQMGPRGDEMAEIISPSDKDKGQIPPELMQQLQQMQQQLQALNEYGKQKEAEIAEMKQKIEGQVVNNEYKIKLQEMDNQNKLAVAAMNNETKSLVERLVLLESFMEKLEGEKHEAAMSDKQQEHERGMADRNAEIEAASQATPPETQS
jgi:hypothetical protein